MNHNKLHSVKGLFLLLLTLTVFLSSAGIYIASAKPQKEISRKVSSPKQSKEERVTASPNFEAVVVSLIHPDFAKEILFYSFDFSIVTEEVLLPRQRSVIS